MSAGLPIRRSPAGVPAVYQTNLVPFPDTPARRYVCDNNEISVLDISNLNNPVFLGAALASSISNSGDIRCSVQRNTLVAFADGVSSAINGTRSPAFVTFDVTNPTQPQLVTNTTIGARFFDEPVWAGNT